MEERYPAFEASVSRFQDFLKSEGWPTEVWWFRRGDVLRRGDSLAVRDHGANEEPARQAYSSAISAGFGVLLEAVCHDGNRTFARVVRPVDADAQVRGLFPDGLKLSVHVSPPVRARLISSAVSWWLWSTAGSIWPFYD